MISTTVLKDTDIVDTLADAEMTGTYSATQDHGIENVVTPAASTSLTNHASSTDTHHAERWRLQSLPSSVLNPLGLLAEASLRGSDETQSEGPSPRQSPAHTYPQLPGQGSASIPDLPHKLHRNNRNLPGVGNARYFEVKLAVRAATNHVAEVVRYYSLGTAL